MSKKRHSESETEENSIPNNTARYERAEHDNRSVGADVDWTGIGWTAYRNTWPGCTWLWLYLNPAPLSAQLDAMAAVDIDLGTRFRLIRWRAMNN